MDVKSCFDSPAFLSESTTDICRREMGMTLISAWALHTVVFLLKAAAVKGIWTCAKSGIRCAGMGKRTAQRKIFTSIV